MELLKIRNSNLVCRWTTRTNVQKCKSRGKWGVV